MDVTSVDQAQARLRQRPLVLALVLVFVALSIQYAFKVSEGHNRGAVARWQEQVLEIFDRDIYQVHNYPNPPVMALLLYGIAKLPPLAESLCWFYLKAGMTLLALYWVFRVVESPGQPFPRWAKVLAVLLSMRPIMGDFLHGNINLFILFLVAGALYAFTRGRDFICGIVLGLAIACKVTPLLFVPYFAWKRAWGTLVGCAAGLALALAIVPGLILGPRHNQQLLASWYRQMVEPYVVAGQVTSEHPNQSLPGLVYRLASAKPSFSTDYGVPLRYDNLVNLHPTTLRWLLKACMAAFVLLAVWCCRTPISPRGGWRLAAEYALVLLGMLLFSERTWKHHCVTLLVPFAVLSYQLGKGTSTPRMRAGISGCLVLVALLMASTSTTLLRLPGDTARGGALVPDAAKMAQVYGAYVWANLLLVAAVVATLRTGKGNVVTPMREADIGLAASAA